MYPVFDVKCRYENPNNFKSVHPPAIIKFPEEISWTFDSKKYSIHSHIEYKTERVGFNKWIRKSINNYHDLIRYAYLLHENILVLYSAINELNRLYPPPNNLILYNLKKEVVKVIENPTIKKVEEQRAKDIASAKPLTFWDKLFGNKPIEKEYYVSPFLSIWGIKEIEGRKYIQVNLEEIPSYTWYTYYLDAETFEFHPKYYDYNEDDGRYSKCIEYGRE